MRTHYGAIVRKFIFKIIALVFVVHIHSTAVLAKHPVFHHANMRDFTFFDSCLYIQAILDAMRVLFGIIETFPKYAVHAICTYL